MVKNCSYSVLYIRYCANILTRFESFELKDVLKYTGAENKVSSCSTEPEKKTNRMKTNRFGNMIF